MNPNYLFRKSGKKAIAPTIGATIGTIIARKIGADPTLGAAAGAAIVAFIWDCLKRNIHIDF